MEEYYIKTEYNGEEINLHYYHKDKFSISDIKKTLSEIYDGCKLECPKCLENGMFKHYIRYKLSNQYGFYLYSDRNIYDISEKDVFE